MRWRLLLLGLGLLGCGRVAVDSGDATGGPLTCDSRNDLDGDGFADLVVPEDPSFDAGGAPSWQVSVYRGSGSGYRGALGFEWKEGFGSNLIAFSLGDTRGLQLTDVGFSPYQTGAAEAQCGPTQVLRAEDGTLELRDLDVECPWSVLPSGYYQTLAFGDVNHDGASETLAVNELDTEMELFLLDSQGSVLASVLDAAPGKRDYVAVGDVDADGFPDAFGLDHSATEIQITLIRGSESGLAGAVVYGSFALPSGALAGARLIGDVNGDGGMDFQLIALKTPAQPDEESALALSSGDGLFDVVAFDPQGALIPSGDIDCDGHDDVLMKRYESEVAPDQKALDVLHGTANGVAHRRTLTIPIDVNGTDVLPVFAPFNTR